MGRPQKQTVDYFPHFANASERKTLYILEGKHGITAYAFWFKLLEILASTPGHYLNFNNPAEWEYLLAKTKVDDDTGRKILDELALLDAIDNELYQAKYLWSQNLVNGIAEVYRRRQMALPQKPSLNNQKPQDSGINDDINNTPSVVSTDRNTQREELEVLEELERGSMTEELLPSFITYKDKLAITYPDLDVEKEWVDCQIWFRDRKKTIKSQSLTLGNWCRKAMEIRSSNGAHRGDTQKLKPSGMRIQS